MKKKLDTTGVLSELSGQSAFFPGYKKSVSPTSSQTVDDSKKPEMQNTPVPSPVPGTEPHTVRGPVPQGVPPILKVKRPIRQRQPFDIYEDQYHALKKIADAERDYVNGRNMSQMVRQAIDNYLKENNITE